MGSQELNQLVQNINPMLESLNQEPFYSHPQFHSSFAWTCKKKIDTSALTRQDVLTLKEFRIHVDQVHIRMGNKKFQFNFI